MLPTNDVNSKQETTSHVSCRQYSNMRIQHSNYMTVQNIAIWGTQQASQN